MKGIAVIIAMVLLLPVVASQSVGETGDYISLIFPKATVRIYKYVPRVEIVVNGSYTGVEFTHLFVVDDLRDAKIQKFTYYTTDFSGGWNVKISNGTDGTMGMYYHVSISKEVTLVSPSVYGPPETVSAEVSFEIYVAERDYSKNGYVIRNNDIRIDIFIEMGREVDGYVGMESRIYGSNPQYSFSGVDGGWIDYTTEMENTPGSSIDVSTEETHFGYRWNDMCSSGSVTSLYQKIGNELNIIFLYSSSLSIHHDPELTSPVPFFMETPSGGAGEVLEESVEEIRNHVQSIFAGVAVGVLIIGSSYLYLRRKP